MRWGWLTLAVLAAGLQSTVLYRALPGGATPDLVQALTMAGAVNGGLLGGVVFGFVGGLCMGLVQQSQLAASAALYLILGWLVGIYSDIRRPLRPKELVLFSGLASLAVWAVQTGPSSWSANLPALAPQMLWQTLFLMILVPLTRK